MMPGSPHPVVLLPIDAASGRPSVPSALAPLLYFASVTEPGMYGMGRGLKLDLHS